MCRFCRPLEAAGLTLEDAQTMLKIHGFVLLQPNAPKQYHCCWDGRIVASGEKAMMQKLVDKAHEEHQVGLWDLRQQILGPLEPVDDTKSKVGAEFWHSQT